MKSMGGSGQPVLGGAIRADEALRYAMSLPVAVTVSGMETLEVLQQNLGVARGLSPMSEDERARLRERVVEYAKNGRFELYKVSKRYDAEEGRAQHGYPPPDELPL
ncbi:MAG: hypothetical protein E6J78_19065 [Deltaproteobacteria bacterium]|nr:MAG: hypothetical protein E6J78_19065 [Deltaproteobacteria bacterium]